ncbi:hypothetical protein ACIQMR_26830 [Streptomyces sp. NPDC091376]|uniref:hypothetical protein n=1 Tax=Streptomyces sp. NPDC091376 TaxID=3365994 RepID=UPI0037FDBAC0
MTVLKRPDAVYHSTAGSTDLIFRQVADVVVTRADKAGGSNVITAYGSSGIKGSSGAGALGGSPPDPGAQTTQADVVEGRIRAKNDCTPPAVQVR